MGPDPFAAFAAAVASEKAAWLEVQDRLPGTPEFDLSAWTAWNEARARADAARHTLAKAMGRSAGPTGG